jgi:hypothetical protein
LEPFFSNAAKFHQLSDALRTLQNMEILEIGKVKLSWSLHKSGERSVIKASDALGIWIMFQHVFLHLVE